MNNYNPYFGSGRWYKGNLHTHSTLSDGTYTPEELKEVYKQHGYSFLALSDHRSFYCHDELNDPNFLIYPSMEGNMTAPEETLGCGGYRAYHMQVLYDPEIPTDRPLEDGERIEAPERTTWEQYYISAQKYIDTMRARGNLITVNHPIWSRLRYEDVSALDGFFAMEIYNSECALDGMDTGEGTVFWDLLLRQGKKVWGIAADDCHNRNKPDGKAPIGSERFSSCRGWVQVYAPELSVAALSKALKEGRFYSSTGPEITRFEVKNGIAYLACSAVQKIELIGEPCRARGFFDPEAQLTEANWKLDGRERYIRAQVTDRSGRKAWTNPIFFD
jgi:hypothetical protein